MKKIFLLVVVAFSGSLNTIHASSTNLNSGTYNYTPTNANGLFKKSLNRHGHERKREIKEVRCPSHPKK